MENDKASRVGKCMPCTGIRLRSHATQQGEPTLGLHNKCVHLVILFVFAFREETVGLRVDRLPTIHLTTYMVFSPSLINHSTGPSAVAHSYIMYVPKGQCA